MSNDQPIEIDVPARIALRLPPISELLRGLEVQPWITDRHEAARINGGNLEKAAAMGRLLRHVETLVEQEHSYEVPFIAARAWADELEDAELDELMRALAERCQELYERLTVLTPAGALRALRDVDDLESVVALLQGNDFPMDAAWPVFDEAKRVLPKYRGEIARCPQLRAALREEDSFIGRIA